MVGEEYTIDVFLDFDSNIITMVLKDVLPQEVVKLQRDKL